MSAELAGQVALVTGASRGIGSAIASELALRGAHVFVNYQSRRDAADAVASSIAEKGGKAEVIGFNVAASAEVDAAIDTIREKAGKLDILVNNAGVAYNGLLLRVKDEDWHRIIDVNLSGAFFCARAAARGMARARYGRIINISSIVGESGNEGQSPYAAAKAGLLGLTKSLALELSSRNITVNAITPGFIDTEMTSGLDDKLKDALLSRIPLNRYGTGDEIAQAVAFLASPGAAYITGQVIGINGGMRM